MNELWLSFPPTIPLHVHACCRTILTNIPLLRHGFPWCQVFVYAHLWIEEHGGYCIMGITLHACCSCLASRGLRRVQLILMLLVHSLFEAHNNCACLGGV